MKNSRRTSRGPVLGRGPAVEKHWYRKPPAVLFCSNSETLQMTRSCLKFGEPKLYVVWWGGFNVVGRRSGRQTQIKLEGRQSETGHTRVFA